MRQWFNQILALFGMSIQQGEVLYSKGDASNQLPIISPMGGSFQLMSQYEYRINKKIAKVAVEENVW